MQNIPNLKIDKDDEYLLDLYNWSINNCGYLVTYPRGTRSCLLMHRIITGARPGEILDHINQDKLDNRKTNLRFVTDRVNKLNNKSSGVHLRPWGKWEVYIGRKYLGSFDDFESASAHRTKEVNKILQEELPKTQARNNELIKRIQAQSV